MAIHVAVTLVGGPHDGSVTSHTLHLIETRRGELLIENISYPLNARGERTGGYYFDGVGMATWRAYEVPQP